MVEHIDTPKRGRGRPTGTGARESDAVKRVRLAHGKTQMEWAIYLGIAESTEQRMEKLNRLPQSKPVMQRLEKAAKEVGESI